MAVELIYGASTELTITLASIADGAGRLATIVDNSVDSSGSDRAQAIQVYASITTGAIAHTDDSLFKFYVVGHDAGSSPNISDDNLGTADAALTVEPENSMFLFSIRVTAATATAFEGHGTFYDPPPGWSIAFWNATGQTNSTTEAESVIRFVTVKNEAQ